ncbi:Hypothetical protein LOCK908_1808 [Lacticaseibacillus rhamnosus LOCK908]|nr:hypothetical protein LRHK_1745 [Lacticaseibacillus rhamnosus ATCC 8530]AGP74444.1 Hypothetical protein LOCK908_1808 [Lacticaseibacillus rhamnosus LOCK908]
MAKSGFVSGLLIVDTGQTITAKNHHNYEIKEDMHAIT